MLREQAEVVKRQNKMIKKLLHEFQQNDTKITNLKDHLNVFKKIKKAQKEFKKNTDYMADCPFCRLSKEHLRNVNNYMEHI